MATECSSNKTTSNVKQSAKLEQINTDTNNNNNNNAYQSFKIKTKSIENTLLPLVNQISTLVNFKDNLKHLSTAHHSLLSTSSSSYSERTANALMRVGESVNLAVERFVSVGESIAKENQSIKFDMLEACKEARNAGIEIRSQTQIPNSIVNVLGVITTPTNASSLFSSNEKITMIQSANLLLNSVTKVLLLADVVLINQILNSKNKVLQTLNKLENVIDFYSFINLFSQYGADLIELAHLSGERQNDLKDDKRKSQLSSSRWILEKSTIMILSSTKAYLKHTECECAKENVSLVYSFLYQALESLHYVIVDSGSIFDSPLFNLNIIQGNSFINSLRQYEDALELTKNNMLLIDSNSNENYLTLSLNNLIDSTQDYTDSLYINNENRDKILMLQTDLKEKTILFIQSDSKKKIEIYDLILNDLEFFKKILQTQTMLLANNLFKENQDATLLNCIKTYSLSNHYDLLIETMDKFKDYSDHVLDVIKMLRHVSCLDLFEVTCEHHYNVFDSLSKMLQSAAGTAALYPTCKSTIENLNLYCECWENQINDLSVLVKEMHEYLNGSKSDKSIYLSLPRPGKHGTSARISKTNQLNKPSKLDSTEQAKITKLGLEMKLIQSEIEAEADKWNEPHNEIVKLAKLMSEMAYEIHLFTRGEGSLKTTQDLFNRAEIFLRHGVLLYGIVKEFVNQVPNGYLKDELVHLLERLPYNFKQLKNKLKQVTVGKTATFNKVDCVIQDTRDFMNLVAKLVTNCFLCCTKYNISYEKIRENQIDSSNLNPEYFINNNKQENIYVNSNETRYHRNHNHLNSFLKDFLDEDVNNINLDLNKVLETKTNRNDRKSAYYSNLQNRFSSYLIKPQQQQQQSQQPQQPQQTRSDSCGPSFRPNRNC